MAKTTPGTAVATLPPAERAAVALKSKEREKTLIALAGDSKAITVITNKDGYAECHAARMRLKNERVSLEKDGKDARDDATKFSKGVIAEENRLIGLILPEEKRLQTIQDAWDAIEEQKRQAEAERIKDLQDKVEVIKLIPGTMGNYNADEIAKRLNAVANIDISTFAEFASFAESAKETTIAALERMLVGALAQEKAAAEAAEKARRDAEELARLRAAEEQRQKDEKARLEVEAQARAKADAEARARIEAEEKAANDRIAEQERIAKVARDAEDLRLAQERAQREEEDRRAAEARAQEEARLKAQRDELEAKQREIQRQADELLSGAEMLRTFIDRFGRRKEFEQVVAAIRVYLQAQPKQQRKAA